jgi:regulator of replication initiation timing
VKRADLKIILDKITQDVQSVTDDKFRSILTSLLNFGEAVIAENDELRAENQKLRDEINRLKGEQGKPDIRKQAGAKSAAKERRTRNPKRKSKSTVPSSARSTKTACRLMRCLKVMKRSSRKTLLLRPTTLLLKKKCIIPLRSRKRSWPRCRTVMTASSARA